MTAIAPSEMTIIPAMRVMSASSQSVHVVGRHHASPASCNTMQVRNTIHVLDGRRAPKRAGDARLLMVCMGSMLQ
jgi:hypothetical protein